MEKPREGLISPSELRSTVGFQEAKKHDPDGKLLIILAFKTFSKLHPETSHTLKPMRGDVERTNEYWHTRTLSPSLDRNA